MEKVTLNAVIRDTKGKGAARSMRRAGSLPAVIYRSGKATALTLNAKETLQFLRATIGEKVLVNLQLPNSESRLALIKEYQKDPVRGDLLHIDFQEVSLKEKIRVTVKVTTVGEAVGVKRDGGILQTMLREIEIECLPDRIPGHLEVDISGLTVNHSVHVSDIKLPDDVKILTDLGESIATVTAPAALEAATAAAVVEEPAAPEVVKKGKKEEKAEG